MIRLKNAAASMVERRAKLDPVIGRIRNPRNVIGSSRKTKEHPVLQSVNRSVGKTAIVEGLAQEDRAW